MKSLYILLFSTLLYAEPAWINNTSHLSQKYIYGLGISNDINPVNKRYIAIANARASLAQNIKVEIKSYFKMTKQSNNDKYTRKTNSIVEQKANELLVGSSIENSFIDNDGVLYILMKMSKLKVSSL